MADAPILPGWALVHTGPIRLAGYVREVEVCGVKFLEVCAGPPTVAFGSPPPDRLQLINPSQARSIIPVSEETARKRMREQWGVGG